MIKILISIISILSPSSLYVGTCLKDNIKMSSNLNDNKINTSNAMWGGLVLSYFIYKHSDMETNNDWNDFLSELSFEGRSDVKSPEAISIFKQELIASAVNISMYGMTSYREFFAEAHTKWISTPKNARNLSWEILDYFFRIIMPKLIVEYDGDILLNLDSEGKSIDKNKFDKIKEIIDNDIENSNSAYVVKSDSLIYKTSNNLIEPNQKLKLSDLEYVNESFGYVNTKEKNKVSAYIINGTLKAFKHSLGPEYKTNYSNYGLDITLGKDKGDIEDSNNQLINFWKSSNNQENIVRLLPKFSNLEYYTYKKADDIASQDFDNYVNKLKSKYSNSIDDLSNKLKKNTNGIIDLKANIDGISLHKNFSRKLKTDMEDLILTTYNIDSDLATGGGKFNNYIGGKSIYDYFLTNLVFADTNIIANDKNTMAYTSVSMKSLSNEKVDYATSIYGYIVFKGDSFNSSIDQYQNSWWSSPNICTTFSHEMGHLLDGFMGLYGSSKSININMRISAKRFLVSFHDEILNNSKTDKIYNGKVFSDYKASYISKPVLYLIISSAIIGLFFISVSLFLTIRKK